MLAPMPRCPILLMMTLAACGHLPQDPEGTLDRVRRDRVIHVGMVLDSSGEDALAWRHVVARIENATGASSRVRTGAIEPLLMDLEAGKLDLVIGGRFDKETPWKTRVTLGPPMRVIRTEIGETALHLATRNGENAWITLVQRSAKSGGRTS
jgi:hypothetical protein